MSDQRHNPPERGGIAVIGAGPAGLLAAIALARRGIRTTVLERQDHPQVSPRFDPERSYTIDITGHGHRALQHIDATAYFDAPLLAFRGIQHGGRWSRSGARRDGPEARAWLRRHCPRILDLASPEAVAASARRRCHHIGQKLTCSSLSAGRCVLIGDAAGPFPPIGQGVNAALESAMVLDLAIGRSGTTPEGLVTAAASYDEEWRPEVDAVSWISEKMLFENRVHMLRADLTMRLGINPIDQAKDGSTPWSVVAARARRLGPLWR